MSDPHLLEIQGRLKRVLLEARVEEGFDRDASHALGRYVAHEVGVGWNSALLENREVATAFAESAVEGLLNALTTADIERMLEAASRRGEPLLHAEDRTGGDALPDMGDVVDEVAEGAEPSALTAATPRSDDLDALALEMAREQAEATGLPLPASADEIKLGHWRRKALLRAWNRRDQAA